jgi:signal transduction histidine kinase
MTSWIWKTAPAMLGVAMVAASGSSAYAQTTGTSGTVGPAGAVIQTSSAKSSPTPALANTPAVASSPAEQQSAAETIVERGANLSQRVSQMLDEARRESDIIRITCLNDKLTQVNANLRTAQSRLTSLQKALDSEQRNHELTVLSVLGQKLQVLDQESNQCVGQDLYETGPTKITTEIDTSYLPFEADPSTPAPVLPPTLLDAPPSASSDGSPQG